MAGLTRRQRTPSWVVAMVVAAVLLVIAQRFVVAGVTGGAIKE